MDNLEIKTNDATEVVENTVKGVNWKKAGFITLATAGLATVVYLGYRTFKKHRANKATVEEEVKEAE